MKTTVRIFIILVIGVAGLLGTTRTQAQDVTLNGTLQAPNFNFERWDEITYRKDDGSPGTAFEPWGWNSSLTFDVKGYPSTDVYPKPSVFQDEPHLGGTGHSARLQVSEKNRWGKGDGPENFDGQDDFGTLTTGTIYYAGKEIDGSCIYSKIGDESKSWKFTGRPDSITFWAKTAVTNQSDSVSVKLFLHGPVNFVSWPDMNYGDSEHPYQKWVMNDRGEPDRLENANEDYIGGSRYYIGRTEGQEWKRYSFPIEYVRDENPSYLLLLFTAAPSMKEVWKDDQMWIDDVIFVYNPILRFDDKSKRVINQHGGAATLDLPYTFYSGSQDPKNPGAQNQLNVYLSDVNGNFTTQTLIGSVNVNGGDNVLHQTSIRVTLPADAANSPNYKIRIESTNYDLPGDTISLDLYRWWNLTISGTNYGITNNVYMQHCAHDSVINAFARANNEKCRFLRWEENGTTVMDGEQPAAADYTFHITRDRNLMAIFDTTFTLTFAESVGAEPWFENENAINNRQELTIVRGETALVRARIKEGYVFRQFYLDPIGTTENDPRVFSQDDGVVCINWPVERGGAIEVRTDTIEYEFEFSVSDDRLATVNPSGNHSFKHFTTVVAKAEPKEPQEYSHFSRWNVLRGSLPEGADPTNPELRFENIGTGAGGSYQAVFTETTFKVSVRVSEAGGGYVLQCAAAKADSTYSAFNRTSIFIRAVANTGWSFRYWTVSRNGEIYDTLTVQDLEDGVYYVTKNEHLDANYEFTAFFGPLDYTLNVAADPAAYGSASGSGTYPYGTRVTLQATPNFGYRFVKWVSGSTELGTSQTHYVTVLQDSVIRAVFEAEQFKVEISSNDESLGRVNNPEANDQNLYPYGSTLQLTAEPATGKEFRYWIVDGDTLPTSNPVYDFTVSKESTEIVAIFSEPRSHVTVTSNNPSYGWVSGGGVYEWHSPVEILAEVFPGHTFVGWFSNGVEVSKELRIFIEAIEGDTTLEARFLADQFTVKIQAGEHGKVVIKSTEMRISEETITGPDTKTEKFDFEDFIEIQAVPDETYEFAGWYDKNGNLQSSYKEESFSVIRDTVIIGRFVEQLHAVGLFAWPMDVGELSGMGRYAHGTTADISINISEGYTFEGWWEEDTLYTESPSFSIQVLTDRYFTARFEKNRYTINLETDSPELVNGLSGDGEYKYSFNTNVYADVKQGYEVEAWINSQGDTVSRRNPYLHDIEGNETLTAVIRKAKLYPTFIIEPEDAGSVACGDVFYGEHTTATAKPAYGYVFSHWENAAGVKITENASLDFVTKVDTTFKAVFDSAIFHIVAKPRNPLRGWITASGYENMVGDSTYLELDYKYLSTCELFVVHDLHYDFAGFHDNETGEVVSYQHRWIFTVTGDMDVIAWFEPKPVVSTLRVEPETGGTVQYQGGQMLGDVSVLYEDSIRLDVIPAQGMEFNKYILVESKDNTDTVAVWENAQHAFVPQGGRTVTAFFDTIGYNIGLSVEPAGSGSVQGDGEYKYGTWASLKAEADEHYLFYAYKAGDEVLSYDSAYALQVDSAMEIRAVFSPKEYLVEPRTSDSTQGNVSGKGRYAYGSTVTLEAYTWSDSVEFDYWSRYADGRDTVALIARISHEVRGDTGFTAFFKPASYQLRLQVSGNGKVLLAEGEELPKENVYVHGSEVSLVAQAEAGYHFSAWKENGIILGTETEISFDMKRSRTIEAIFEPDMLRVSLASLPTSVHVFGAGSYAYGSHVNIYTDGTPAGYRFVAWVNDAGDTVSIVPDFVLPVTQDTSLRAEWQAERYRIELKVEGRGDVKGAQANGYPYGAPAELTAIPKASSRFKAWYRSGELFSERATLTLTVFSNLTLTAVFEENTDPDAFINRLEGGYVSVTEKTGSGDTLILQAQPEPSFHFAYWTLGDTVISTDPRIETDKATSLRALAHFMPDVFYVELSSTTPEGLRELIGSGSFYKDDQATLKVDVRKGYEFIGWFEEDSTTPISTQTEYTFKVSRSIKLDARTRKTTNQ
ncbi:MAG: InlB B-repeat-containing protein [Lentimicrobiaceae bacterium]|nr:InlB B-repeat-containing protein [Lentimicrobiaceae bacterium]